MRSVNCMSWFLPPTKRTAIYSGPLTPHTLMQCSRLAIRSAKRPRRQKNREAASRTWICELKKTSLTDPLQIAAVAAGAGFGRVGITLCPGKCDPHAMSGEWEHDLALDLLLLPDDGGDEGAQDDVRLSRALTTGSQNRCFSFSEMKDAANLRLRAAWRG
jgi:hypothetical protein